MKTLAKRFIKKNY